MSFIKVREKGERRWRFLCPSGSTTRLRVHAGRFESVEKAQAFVDANAPSNPEWEWKVVL